MTFEIDNTQVSSCTEDGYYLVQCCIDGGICRHTCGAGCFRKVNCVPQGTVEFLDDDWKRIDHDSRETE